MGKFTLCIILGLGLSLGTEGTENKASLLKAHPPVVLESLVSNLPQDKAILALAKVIKEVAPIARGTQIQAGSLNALYLASLENFRKRTGAKAADWIFEEGEMWFQLFERISYEEGRFQSLVDVIKARDPLWKALEEKLKEFPLLAPDLKRWLEVRKPGYPVDRIFLLEAKARWPQSLMKSAEKITQYLQKQPELSLAVISKSIKLAPTKEVQSLEKEWAETQIQLMKEDLAKYEKLLKLAALRPA